MSADNGYVVRKNNQGEYVVSEYFASFGYPPIGQPGELVFDTIEDVFVWWQDETPYCEYGLTFDIG